MPGEDAPWQPYVAQSSSQSDPALAARLKELNERVDAALRRQIEREVRERIAQEIEAARLEWNDMEPEGPNGCCDADVHNCHRDAGERAFIEAIRIARGGQA